MDKVLKKNKKPKNEVAHSSNLKAWLISSSLELKNYSNACCVVHTVIRVE